MLPRGPDQVDYNRRLDDDGSEHTAADGAKALLYFGTWLQAVACLYFALAAALTSFAVYSPGAEAERAPFLVWVAWMLHGMVLPASLVNALFWPFVAEVRPPPPPPPARSGVREPARRAHWRHHRLRWRCCSPLALQLPSRAVAPFPAAT